VQQRKERGEKASWLEGPPEKKGGTKLRATIIWEGGRGSGRKRIRGEEKRGVEKLLGQTRDL